MADPDILHSLQDHSSSNPGSFDEIGGLTIHFWGVRGSIPTPGADTVRYGGNTACVEILVAGRRLIFDGGTGLRVLGKHLLQTAADVNAHIFFTHTHWDRIQGFPFFLPAFQPDNTFSVYGATALNGASIKQQLSEQMLQPNFFTPLQQMQAALEFKHISAGSVIQLDTVLIETIGLNQQTNALGYRVTWNDLSVVYATDTDHSQGTADANLQYLAADADVLIIDGTYIDHQYHDSFCQDAAAWQPSVDLAASANVKKLIMFHHNPCHSDDRLDQLEVEIRDHFPTARLAREGMIVHLGSGKENPA
ncbi:MBL fold metallo-hydrolase [filamentous cyanobacterium CCP5]|nr:MBL fold metallo-hydrolase [filamentous cyanobacterium CCP5]